MILIQMHFPGPDIKAWDSHVPNWAAEYKGGSLRQQQEVLFLSGFQKFDAMSTTRLF